MSSIANSSQKLTLIENPKTRKDWENNKAYYQQKFFTEKQKKDERDRIHKLTQAKKIIGLRQEYGMCGRLACRAGHDSEAAEKRAWAYKVESMKIEHERYHKKPVNTETTSNILEAEVDSHPNGGNSETETPFPVDNCYLNLTHRPEEAVDSWEDLC
jgi:hypothetical protein